VRKYGNSPERYGFSLLHARILNLEREEKTGHSYAPQWYVIRKPGNQSVGYVGPPIRQRNRRLRWSRHHPNYRSVGLQCRHIITLGMVENARGWHRGWWKAPGTTLVPLSLQEKWGFQFEGRKAEAVGSAING